MNKKRNMLIGIITIVIISGVIFGLVKSRDNKIKKDEIAKEAEMKKEQLEKDNKDLEKEQEEAIDELNNQGDLGLIDKGVDQLEAPKSGDQIAIIKTNHGDLKFKLLPEAAPKAVANFIELSQQGYYKDVIFHRIIEDFMIQGGDPEGTGMGGESSFGEPFEDEFEVNARNYNGALSMANSGPNTNGSQFFIVSTEEDVSEKLEEMRNGMGEQVFNQVYPEQVVERYEELSGTPWLDFNHSVFGQLYEGQDVLKEINKVSVDPETDKPLEDVIISDIVIKKIK